MTIPPPHRTLGGMGIPLGFDTGFPPTSTVTELSVWDQVAPRVYVHAALCFPLPRGTTPTRIENHLRSAVNRLSECRHDLAGGLIMSSEGGKVFLVTAPGRQISFSVLEGTDTNTMTYDDLRARGFPPSAFILPEVAADLPNPTLTSNTPAPVVQIRLLFLHGGLLIVVSTHHSYLDGRSRGLLLEMLGTATSLDTADGSPFSILLESRRWEPSHCTLAIPIPDEYHHSPTTEPDQDAQQQRLARLLSECEEYALFGEDELRGPTQPLNNTDSTINPAPTTTAIFVMDSEKLDALRARSGAVADGEGKKVSRFCLLAALLWTHTCAVRSEMWFEGGGKARDRIPLFINQHNWSDPRKGLFPDNESVRDYFGNSVGLVVTRLGGGDSEDDSEAESLGFSRIRSERNGDNHDHNHKRNPISNGKHNHDCNECQLEVIIKAAQKITKANRAVTSQWVAKRTALFTSLLLASPNPTPKGNGSANSHKHGRSDVRRLAVKMDSRLGWQFWVNSWEFSGGGARFCFPLSSHDASPSSFPTSSPSAFHDSPSSASSASPSAFHDSPSSDSSFSVTPPSISSPPVLSSAQSRSRSRSCDGLDTSLDIDVRNGDGDEVADGDSSRMGEEREENTEKEKRKQKMWMTPDAIRRISVSSACEAPNGNGDGDRDAKVNRKERGTAAPHGLVLPARSEGGEVLLEVQVTLEVDAMRRLLGRGEWMGFVKRVVF